jgi:hypothetical protein
VKRICLALLAAMLCSTTWGAVNARLSEDFIDELESVRLVIRATGTRQTETLDLSGLEHDFHVMGTNTSSQYQYINGREQSWVDYQITLQPKRTGTLAIPRIAVGNEMSNPLQLIVQPIANELRDKINELVFFENELSSRVGYVQGQIVVTRRLLYSSGVQLYSEIPGAPDIPNAVVLVLGETKSTQTMRDNKRYGVVEQRYAIFPEASGELVIPGISITASVRIIDDGRVSRKGVRVGTDDLAVTIKPVPSSYPKDVPWLPAQAVTMTQSWDPDVGIGANVGDTLERRIDVRVHGNTGSSAPPLALALATDQFRQYPQAPSIEDDTRGQSVVGLRTETVSVVPQVPGELTVPTESITWWDTIDDQLRVTTLPATVVQVFGDAIEQSTQPRRATNAPPAPVDTQAEEPLSLEMPTLPWRWLVVFAVLAGVGVLIWRSRERIHLPDALKSKAETGKQAKQLTRALADRDAARAKRALTGLLNAQPSLQQKPATNELVRSLNPYLYGDRDGPMSDEDRDRALASARELMHATKRQAQGPEALPPLYSN